MKQETKKLWYRDDVHRFCCFNHFYDTGSINQFNTILSFVECSEPNEANIFMVAKDILDHSSRDDLSLGEMVDLMKSDTVYEVPMSEWNQRNIWF